MADKWYLYILECKDGRLYTGVAKDVEARFAQHVAGKGARFTKANPPKRIVYVAECETYSAALKEEWRIKKLSRGQKLALVQAGPL